MSNCLKATHLGKTFPGVVALQNVSLEVPRGHVMALVGANGAGKSTLIKILTGYYDDYEGAIEIDGVRAVLQTPHEAREAGIAVVHQEVDAALIPSLTVTENVLLDRMAQQSLFLNWSALHQQAREIISSIGLTIDVCQRVEDLVLHEKQLLLIARAVSQNVRYLIFDEPTTSLSTPEVEKLFALIRDLKQRGIGIIYISHRLSEVREIADSVIVLRSGQKVAEFASDTLDLTQVSEAMLGAPMADIFPSRGEASPHELILDVRHLNSHALHDIHLQACTGEIVGIAGLVGAGKTELLRALFGADAIQAGEIWLDGQRISLKSPTDAVHKGIYLIPEERRAQGVLIEESIERNLSLPFLSQFAWAAGLMQTRKETTHATHLIQRLGLVPADPYKPVRDLSGGNQQKVAIGKWLGGAPRVLLFDEATQGIDIKAKRDVYDLARTLSASAAVIYASSDIDEVIGIADRVLVMRDGRIVANLSGAELDRLTVLDYATGAREAQGMKEGILQ